MLHTVSTEHSYIPGHKVRPMDFKQVERYADLSRIGIALDESDVREMMLFAMDAIQQNVTIPSITTPVQFLQNWLPGFVKVMTAARKIDELIGISTSGNWEDEQIVQGILENTGTAVPYGDYTNVPFASWNTNFVTRTVVRFEEGMRVGRLEEKRAARVRVDSGGSKRESAGLNLEIQRNLVGFFGFNNGTNQTYGFLNDPGLPAYVTVAENAGSTSTQWAHKTFLEITADIRTAAAQLQNQSQDNINPETVATTLGLATIAYQYLSVTTDFGYSVRKWLTDTYPKMRVVSAPQLNAANGGANVFYLYADAMGDLSTDDGRTWTQVVPAKFQVLGVAQLSKAYEEDYSNATAGAMAKRPYAIVRYSGI